MTRPDRPYPKQTEVLAEIRGHVAVVTLDRPGRRNGVTVQMCQELHHVLQQLASGDTRAVVLRGSGDDFSVGADLAGKPSTSPPSLDELGPTYHAATLLHTMPQVTIAAIDGGCAGAALGWAAACDFRFASERAKFTTGFLKVGVSGDMGLAWSLVRLVGPARARELCLFPEKFDASDALNYGLVTRIFPAPELHERTFELADELAGRDPFVLRMTKANLLSTERTDMAEYIEVESARHLHTTSRLMDGRRSAAPSSSK